MELQCSDGDYSYNTAAYLKNTARIYCESPHQKEEMVTEYNNG